MKISGFEAGWGEIHPDHWVLQPTHLYCLLFKAKVVILWEAKGKNGPG